MDVQVFYTCELIPGRHVQAVDEDGYTDRSFSRGCGQNLQISTLYCFGQQPCEHLWYGFAIAQRFLQEGQRSAEIPPAS